MTVNIASAVAAYARQSGQASEGMDPRKTDPAGDFASMLRDAAEASIATGQKADQVSAAAIVGKADLNELVSAVTSAEVTLETVMAVRDRVVQAYQDILRMPI